jgi:hypothetical protein
MQLIRRENKIIEYIRYSVDSKPYNGSYELRRDECFDNNGKSLSIEWFMRYPSGFSKMGLGDIGNLKLNENYIILNRDNKINEIIAKIDELIELQTS